MTEPQSGVRDGDEPLRRWDPDRIGPYVILGRLGAGAMGQVYLGRSAAGRLVAVKTIKVDLAEEAGFRTRFAQEVAAARRVSGFFTAAVVEADPEADLPWLATAYVPAPSLARLVKACGPLPVGAVRWLAAGCAEALESIHGVGLVHRDLKPSNVLVAPDGPRVIDFGVARAAERMGVSTSRGTVGTPAYMAPEQARDTHQASAASDVYALGATLAFAATGHPPYQGESVMDVLARLATEEPDLSGLPGELTELIAACLQRVPRDRPTSSAMLAQLGPFTETRPGAAGEHSYLPDAAMALIAQYQRNPLLAAGRPDAEDSADDTSASYTELPASYQPKPRHQKSPRWPAGWRRWVKAHPWSWAASSSAPR
jgi:serine/threonine protein kinase